MTIPKPLLFHDIKFGLRRLLLAPQDLPGAIKWREPGPSIDEVSSEHRRLFNDYFEALTRAVGVAVPWWNALVHQTMAGGPKEYDAIRANYELRPAAAASHPELVGVIRHFWLACDQMNRDVAVDQKVPPEVLLLRWLKTPDYDELISVLTAMPYWPVGFDEDGNFI